MGGKRRLPALRRLGRGPGQGYEGSPERPLPVALSRLQAAVHGADRDGVRGLADSVAPLVLRLLGRVQLEKGVSALQIKRQTGLSYKSALFLLHRVRYAMAPARSPRPLKGTVEVDETYVGGKARNLTRAQRIARAELPEARWGHRPPRITTEKAPVVALVERGGEVRAQVVADVSAATLKGVIRAQVDRSATINTDEAYVYRGIGKEFAGGHHAVKHNIGEYARGDVTTNTVEGFFSLLKRGLYGTYHSVSKRHLHRYVSEFEFRYNTRRLDDGARTVMAIRAAEGKRLVYRQPASSHVA